MSTNKYMADPPVQGRECGECTACCVLPRIQDRPGMTSLPLLPQGKPGYTPCQHLGGAGCGRYSERPQVCREFTCLWREGLIAGDERRRPDKLGLMFSLDQIDGVVVIEAWELWTGAAKEYPGKGILERFHKATRRVVVRYYGVPCSLEYGGSVTSAVGERLSMAAREDPRELARWLRDKAEMHDFTDDPDAAAQLDVASLEAGVPIVEHFRPDVGRSPLAGAYGPWRVLREVEK